MKPPAWSVGVLVLLALLLGATSPYFEAFANDNERPRLLQAMAVVDAGEWAIDGPSTRGMSVGADVSRAAGEGARLYPNKPPGATLPAVAAYGLLTLVSGAEGFRFASFSATARVLGSLLPTLLLVAFFFRRYRRSHAPPVVVSAACAYALATPACAYATLLFGHQLTACLLYGGVLLLTGKPGQRPSLALSFVGGLLCGSAISVEYAAVFAGFPIAAFLLWRGGEPGGWSRAGAALGGAAISLVPLMLYQRHAFGSVWTTPYHHVQIAEFADKHGRGLLGLHAPTLGNIGETLFSPWGGLMTWAPVLLFGIAGVVFVARAPPQVDAPATAQVHADTRAEAVLHGSIFVVLLFVVFGLTQTGGWRVGPRYLVAAFPFLLVGLLAAFERARTRPWLAAALMTTALFGAVVNAFAANLFPHLMPEGNPVWDQLALIVFEGWEPWGILGVWPIVILSAGTIFVAIAACVAVDGKLASRAAGALALGALGAGLLLAATTVPSSSPRTAFQARLLERFFASVPGRARHVRMIKPLDAGTQ